jgi:N4-gp56 family major capsid protein
MATTNFALLTNEQKTAWSLDFWKQARNLSFVNKFLGKDANSIIQHVTELKKTEKGARAVITLLADLEGDGIAGDRTLEGNEEALKSYDQVIRIDQMRDAVRHEGRMADQKSVVNFRGTARDRLAYWLADRIDQLAFLTLGGIAYTQHPNGTTRTGSDLKNLEFAADVTAPTSKRYARWNGTTKLIEVGTGSSAVAAADLPMWDMFTQLKAYAKENYIRGVMADGGEETYHAFLSPMAMSKLKADAIYRDNLRYAQQRGDKNELFTGASVKIDGIYLHEFRHVPNTRLAGSGSKYGAGGAVDGCQVLFCGAQALGMADIGNPEWVEKEFDYDNQPGISVQKILGFKKPVFTSQYAAGQTTEDFAVISTYVAQ